jgi:hypothetical protein
MPAWSSSWCAPARRWTTSTTCTGPRRSRRWCWATAGPRHQATLKTLVDAGANLQLKDRTGNTPLQLARSRGYTEMVKLLEAGKAR